MAFGKIRETFRITYDASPSKGFLQISGIIHHIPCTCVALYIYAASNLCRNLINIIVSGLIIGKISTLSYVNCSR